MQKPIAVLWLCSLALAGCQSSPVTPAATEQQAFWQSLQALCGKAYAGRVVEDSTGDPRFKVQPMVMHVRECGDAQVRIPFHVGGDGSRTWVLSQTAAGLRLKHDHRHQDGSEDKITQYGGDTRGPGTASAQEFHADAHTASLIPAAATNVWTVEVIAGQRFAYALRREGTDRRFRVEFDLARPITPPPPPWGAKADTP